MPARKPLGVFRRYLTEVELSRSRKGSPLNPQRKRPKALWFVSGFLITSLIAGGLWIGGASRIRPPLVQDKDMAPSLYAAQYPASSRFQSELLNLRAGGRLKSEDEGLIQRSVTDTTGFLKMPPAILWCLLFQESRLNHLEGFGDSRGSSGLGQFSYFGFYEINNQMERYGQHNVDLFVKILGRDVRPIEANSEDVQNPSSYYYIPTAVVTSAAFLNNRYLSLQRILEKKQIAYSSDLLWFYAALAYNKGTRSVLSLWNNARREGGEARVSRLVSDQEYFLSSLKDQATFTKALKPIWSMPTANAYAKELKIHAKNIQDCSMPKASEGNFSEE